MFRLISSEGKFSQTVVGLRKICMLSFYGVHVAVYVDPEVFNINDIIQDLTHGQAAGCQKASSKG